MTKEELLFKFCFVVKTQGEDPILILFYNFVENKSVFIEADTTKKTEIIYIANAINVFESINEGYIKTESHILDENTIPLYSVANDVSEYFEEIQELAQVIRREYEQVVANIANITKMASCVNSVMMHNFAEDKDMISLSVKNIFKGNALNKIEINSLAPDLSEIISKNVDIDLDDSSAMSKLKDSLEMCIIGKLPPSVSVEDLEVDLGEITKIIKHMRSINE